VKDRRAVWSVSVGILSLLLSGAMRADTLVMRDGRRVDGDLVAVREGVVEFEGRRGFFGGRERMRLDRGDVRSIELSDTGNRFDGDTTRSESAAATVMSLKVEPGSYVSVTVRLRCKSPGTDG